MRRNEPHEIDTRAQRIFEYILPDELVVRRQSSDDYGIDAEIEHFENGESTGVIFKVQLKGKKHPKRIADGEIIPFSYPVRNATYLIEQVQIPTFFILVDVTRKNVYWCDIQNNKSLFDTYNEAKQKGQDSFTLHFHTTNILPKTLPKLLDDVVRTANYIALRRVAKIKPPAYMSYVTTLSDIESELQHLSQKYDIANIQQIARYLELEEYDNAESLINKVVQSPERSFEAKFEARLHFEKVFMHKYFGQAAHSSKADFDLREATQLTQLAKESKNDRLLFLAKIYTAAADLTYAAHQDMQLYLNWKMHLDSVSNNQSKDVSSPPWFSILEIERTKIERTLLDSYDIMHELIVELIERDWLFLPDIVTRVIFSMNVFFLRLSKEGLRDKAGKIEQLVVDLIEFIVQIAEKIPDKHQKDVTLDRCAVAYQMHLDIYASNQNLKQSKYAVASLVIDKIENPEVREKSKAQLVAAFEKQSTTIDETNIDWGDVEGFFRRQAKALGIDLELANLRISDVNHPKYVEAQIARIIDLGIRDINPTRVLKNCKHLIQEYWGSIDEIAKIMQLYSAGVKRVGCIKHPEHGAIGHNSLDMAFDEFQIKYCSKCPHLEAHSPEWKYTTKWHEKRIDEWKQVMRSYLDDKKS